MEQKKTLGLYLHIPFCRSKCLYCDFCSFPHPKEETVDRYVSMLCEDLCRRAAECRDDTVDTVYLGGGTPTLLPAKLPIKILDTVAKHYHLSSNAEITLECNPATGDRDSFVALRKSGFNRVSIGLQSAHRDELRALGRRHDFEQFCKTFAELRDADFTNVSADVMFGLPLQTTERYLQTLEKLCALSPEHISAYGLIVEDGTPFSTLAARGQLPLPDEETTREMYFAGISLLASHGIAQYEISNFAKKGYESRHNLKYWNCDEYLGFGPAAYSDFGGSRFGNSRDLVAYNEGKSILEETETPDQKERMNEYVMLRMRLCEGVSASAFEARFGMDFEEAFGQKLSRYRNGGFVRKTEDGYAFTPEGMYVSNAILSEVLDF